MSYPKTRLNKGDKMIDLCGKWKVTDDDGEFKFEGTVPGTVQGDLVALKLMPHPYIGENEKLFRRLETKSWEYSKDFEIKKLDKKYYDLVIEGIDTLAEVYINGKFVGKCEDMFIGYRFPVKEFLKIGKNTIRVKILSPIKVPKAFEQNHGKLHAGEESARVYIRKAQYSYGWDWGARIATSGIWKKIYIEERNDAYLEGSTAYLEDIDTVKVTGYVMAFENKNYTVKIFVDKKEVGNYPVRPGFNGHLFEGKFDRGDLELWYPRGYGKSVLHNFEFKLFDGKEEISSEKKRIGLRTVRIIQKRDAEGESFIFEINGRRIFAKGADWIPSDNILTWLKDEDYDKLLNMAADANMNMLRVWGGGIYENERFYEKCDELGITVWQDFMFACAEYPDNLEWFRKLAGQEARYNVVKLRYHPSIVLWCGNNENNWGFEEWGYNHKHNGEHLGNVLYLQDLPRICAEEDPSRPYWPSSPYGGSKANSDEAGDRHVWNVWSNWVDYKGYLADKSRFVSEFGFQAAPDPKTIDFFAKKSEKEIFGDVMVRHNKQVEGPERIMKFIHNHFGSVGNFDSVIYLSQINQAEAIKTGVDHWRERKYKTAGTLYWQLNDSWPVFSWSSVDYFKRPKALYYYTKRFYADLLPLIKNDEDELRIAVINDSEETEGHLEFDLWTLNGKKLMEKSYDVRIPADSVLRIDNFKVPDNLAEAIGFVRLKVGSMVFENHEIFANLRKAKLEDPHIAFEKSGDILTIKAERPALGVRITTQKDEVLEDNFFAISPDHPKRIKAPKSDFKISSMYDFLK